MPRPSHPPVRPGTEWLSTALAGLLACAVLLPLLGHRVLADWDEGIYAEIAREMLAGHSLRAWLIPHWNGHLWFEKPPLQMWLTACSLRLFGLNTFAARLPSALAGVAVVGLLHHWLVRRRNLFTAWLGTLGLLSAFGFQHAARVGETDTLLSLFCLLAVLGLTDLLAGRRHGWLLFWTGFGLAFMTKGAASLTVPLTALVIAFLVPRNLLRHRRTFALGALLFVAAIVLPWHLYVTLRFGRAFLDPYLGFHVLERATSALEGHNTSAWFYVRVLLVSAPLFSLLYPLALAETLLFPRRLFPSPIGRSGENFSSFFFVRTGAVGSSSPPDPPPDPALGSRHPLLPLAVFALVHLALFTAVRTRLPHYIAPVYPALAAVTAAFLTPYLFSPGQRASRSRVVALAIALLYILAAVLTIPARRALHSPRLLAGYNNPDNREAAALLQEWGRSGTPSPAGPLLVWRQSPIVPLTTPAFYARRLAEQVALAPPPANLPRSVYFNAPVPLRQALTAPRLVLLDTALLASVPPDIAVQPLLAGPGLTLAVCTPKP